MPKMNDISETIRRHVEMFVHNEGAASEVQHLVDYIMNDLIDDRLIGLPTDVRTSVDSRLLEEVGKKFACRPGDDADDICKAVLR